MKYGKEDIDYIARKYRKDCFDTGAAWRKLGIGGSFRITGWKIAASVAAITVLSVSAALLMTHERISSEYPPVNEEIGLKVSPVESMILDFDNMSLSAVIIEIETVYDVKILNVPSDAADRYLTLYYEGNAYELIEAINEIFDSNMVVAYEKQPHNDYN